MPLCSTCRRPIRWYKNRSTGRLIPVDPEPADGGNLVLHDDGTCDVVPPDDGTHVSHFATCPQAASHRRRKT